MTISVSCSFSLTCPSSSFAHQTSFRPLSDRNLDNPDQRLGASWSFCRQLLNNNWLESTNRKIVEKHYRECQERLVILAGRKNRGSNEKQKSKTRGRWSGKGTEITRKMRIASTIDNVPRQRNDFLPADVTSLEEGQAIGQVVSAQANFMKVLITKCAEPSEFSSNLSNYQFPVVNKSSASSNLLNAHKSHQQYEKMALESQLLSTSDFHTLQQPQVGTEILCVVRALLKKLRRKVLVGDIVSLGSIDWIAKRGMIEDVFPRKSQIIDPPIANVDHLLLLFSLAKPQIDPINLSRFLVAAEATDVPFTLALNKVDLVEPEVRSEWRSRLKSWGYDPYFCSVQTGTGINALEDLMIGKVSVVAGPSGVGKSSLINAIRGQREEIRSQSNMIEIGEVNLDFVGRKTELQGETKPEIEEEVEQNKEWVLMNYSSTMSEVEGGNGTDESEKGGEEGGRRGGSSVVNGNEVFEGESEVGDDGVRESLSSDETNGYGWSQLGEDLEASWQVASDNQQIVELRVGEVSGRSGRGRHTTRHVELSRLPNGGLLADTPGFSQPSLATVSSLDVAYLFPEIRLQSEKSDARCAFSDCQHLGEPGCIMSDDWERFRHYSQLLEEVTKREEAEKQELGTKRESDVRYKSGASGLKTAEPRLSLKKHRRESRKQGRQELDTILWEEQSLESENVVKENIVEEIVDGENVVEEYVVVKIGDK